MSDSWNVTLQCLPGSESVSVRGEAVVFISTLFDGKVVRRMLRIYLLLIPKEVGIYQTFRLLLQILKSRRENWPSQQSNCHTRSTAASKYKSKNV